MGSTRVPKAELTGVYGGLVKRMSRKRMGDVPESVEVMWRNRKVLNLGFALTRKAEKWDRCDENLCVAGTDRGSPITAAHCPSSREGGARPFERGAPSYPSQTSIRATSSE
jgi:hypothetical protein